MVLKSEFYLENSGSKSNVRRVLKTLSESPVDEAGKPFFREIGDHDDLIFTTDEEGEKHPIENIIFNEENIPLDMDGNPLYQDITNYKTALLIADGSNRLTEISEMIEKIGISENTRLIGLSQWSNNSILKKEVFNGAWYVDFPRDNYKLFIGHFEDIFHYKPQKIAMFAYDMISVISAVAAYDDKKFNLDKINNATGFSGISGVFRFTKDGVVERLLEIYEVNEGTVRTIDPAPFQFVNNEKDINS